MTPDIHEDDLGAASVETRGIGEDYAELGGRYNLAGIADDD